jgi:hypothetical protein
MLILSKNKNNEISKTKHLIESFSELSDFEHYYKILADIRFSSEFKKGSYTFNDYATFVKQYSDSLGLATKFKIYEDTVLVMDSHYDAFAPLSDLLPSNHVIASIFLQSVYSAMFSTDESIFIKRKESFWLGDQFDRTIISRC